MSSFDADGSHWPREMTRYSVRGASAFMGISVEGIWGKEYRADSRRKVLAHLRIDRRQRVDVAAAACEHVGGLEVLVASRTPQAAGGIDHERMADATAKDRRA